MKRCSRCKAIKPLDEFYRNRCANDGLQDRCRACHLAVNREWAERNPNVRRATIRRQDEKRKRHRGGPPYQRRTHLAVARAIKRGDLVRPSTCACCGAVDSPIYAHHDDYEKPLSVRWLCARCHGRLHFTQEALTA